MPFDPGVAQDHFDFLAKLTISPGFSQEIKVMR